MERYSLEFFPLSLCRVAKRILMTEELFEIERNTIKKVHSIFTSNERSVFAIDPGSRKQHWEKMAHIIDRRARGKKSRFFFRRNGKLCASARAVVCLAMSVAAPPRGARFLAVRRRLHIVPLEHTHTQIYTHSLLVSNFYGTLLSRQFLIKTHERRGEKEKFPASKCVSWNISSPQTPRARTRTSA